MQQALPWITALGVLVVIAAGLALWATRPRQSASLPLPHEWAIAPRAIFSVDERRAFRQLRDAFPEYVVLAKLPLIRLCQPVDPSEIRYWFELLGSIHVSFAICTPQGRVLAAIDLDGERPASRRTLQIKQGVLSTCRIRHLRCTLEHLPSATELKRLLPASTAIAPSSGHDTTNEDSGRRTLEVAGSDANEVRFQTSLTQQDLELGRLPPTPASMPRSAEERVPEGGVSHGFERPVAQADLKGDATAKPAKSAPRPEQSPIRSEDSVSKADARSRRERKPLWQDSGLFQDSFFGIENLRDAGPPSNFGSLLAENARGRGASSGPSISADPSQGMLESERAKLKQQGPR